MITMLSPVHLTITVDVGPDGPDAAQAALLPAMQRRILACLDAGCQFPPVGTCGCSVCEPDGADGASMPSRPVALPDWQAGFYAGHAAANQYRDAELARYIADAGPHGAAVWTVWRGMDKADTHVDDMSAAAIFLDCIADLRRRYPVPPPDPVAAVGWANWPPTASVAITIRSALALLDDRQPHEAASMLAGLLRRLEVDMDGAGADTDSDSDRAVDVKHPKHRKMAPAAGADTDSDSDGKE